MHAKLPSVEQRSHLHFPDLNDLKKKTQKKVDYSISTTLASLARRPRAVSGGRLGTKLCMY